MSEFYKFVSGSPFLTFFLVWLVTDQIVRMFRAACRAAMVKAHGWPPAHLDADGDWKPEPETEDAQ